MPLYDCLIITPWVEAAATPKGENRAELNDDYPHRISAEERTVETLPVSKRKIREVLERAATYGKSFRDTPVREKAKPTVGYGIRLPAQMLEDYLDVVRESKTPRNPLILGAHRDDQRTFQIVRVTQTIAQEGVRLTENITGQDPRLIAPEPNQFTVRTIVDQSVLQQIDANEKYWYLAGEIIPDDLADPTPPGPHERRLSEPMDPAVQQAYEEWQDRRHNVPRRLTRAIMDMQSGVTYGENSAVTVTWQRRLTGQPPAWRLPLQELIERTLQFLPMLRGVVREDYVGAFPEATHSEIA